MIKINNYIEAVFSMQMHNYLGKYDVSKKIYEKYENIIPDDVYLKNKALNEYEIATKQFILKSKPKNLQIVLFDMCRMNCVMCNQSKQNYALSKKYILEAFDMLPYLDTILWQGGEVFLWNNFINLMELASNYKRISQNVITNLQDADKKTIERLSQINNVKLIISVDSANKKNYEQIRKGSCFTTLLKNINLLNKYKKRYKNNISLNINFVILKENYREILDIINFAKKYDFDSVTFNECLSTEKYGNKFGGYIENQIEKTLKIAVVKAKMSNIRITIQRTKNKMSDAIGVKSVFCKLPWNKLLLGEYNTFSPECTCLKRQVYDNNENLSIETMWNSKLMQDYRKHILGIQQNKNICNAKCRLYGHYYLDTVLG